jgi:beta-galactosidase
MAWWKKQKVTHAGSAVFPGTRAPRAEAFAHLERMGVEVRRGEAPPDAHFVLHLGHPRWGEARLVCLRDMPVPFPLLVEWDPRLLEPEREAARRGASAVSVTLESARGDALRDRKDLLRYLRAVMGTDGVVAADHVAQALWSPAALDEELSHDAALDILALFTVHAISDDRGTHWMHTHGLRELDCFDFDLLDPHPELESAVGAWDLVRAVAFGVVEGDARWNGDPYPVVGEGVRFVPSADFRALSGKSHPRWLNALDDEHVTGHAVVCDPARRGFLGRFRGRPRPAALFSGPVPDELPLRFSASANALMADRARATWAMLLRLAEEFRALELPAMVKLRYAEEHLWFRVDAFEEAAVEATLVNRPWGDIGFGEGDRRKHGLDRLSDWMLLTPAGSITPRSVAAARTVRANRPEIERIVREGKAPPPPEGRRDVGPAVRGGMTRGLVVSLSLALLGVPAAAQPAPRQRVSLDAGWRFHQGDLQGQGVIDDSGWRRVDLPHDWGIEGPFDQQRPGETGKLPWWGVGWYRRRLELPAPAGRRLFLDVDGAMSHAQVWLNGKAVGGWPYGYASWRLDLTPFIQHGENLLAIRLDNPPSSSRWYPGGGLFRNVWLVETGPLHVAQWGTTITTPEVTARAATVRVAVSLENHDAAPARAVVRTTVRALAGHGDATATAPVELAAGGTASAAVTLRVRNPRLWSPGTPDLYLAVTTVERGGRVVDREETVFGIRTFRFDPAQGFLLNGQRVPIRGVCLHHDLGPLGAAFNVRAATRQLELMKEMGANAIRTSHNPPAPELLALADRLGLLVMDELVDAWKTAKVPNDYSRLYDQWYDKDLRALIRRDRNHPSVILWSTGNEVPEQKRPEGAAMAARHTAIAHDEDPTRPVTGGHNSPAAGLGGYGKAFDVFGANYHPESYARFRAVNPTLPLIASETSSAVSSRGEYFFPVTADKSGGRADFQVSSYDLYAPRWGASPDEQFRALDQAPWIAGEFVWTGFDYLGEPTPYNRDATNLLNASDPAEQRRLAAELQRLGKISVPSRSSYFGIVDTAGFAKDRYYLYQAHWRPALPMAHLLPHWTWPERVGQVTPVHVYTSGDEAELLLNGRSLGRKKKAPLEYRLRWDDVVYQPGTLEVRAYKGGRPWATDLRRTAGPPAALRLAADRTRVAADGKDLSFITASVVDAQGVLVPRARSRIQFSVTGPGAIVATDNGDATSHEPFPSRQRQAYNGLALVIVRGAGPPGRVTVRAEADGLAFAQAVIETTR